MTVIRVEEVQLVYEDFRYRTPIKFGGVALDRVTLLNVQCRVRNRAGKSAAGFGSIPLGNVWAFPSKRLGYDATLAAMKAVAERIAVLMSECPEYGHPIDLAHLLEPSFHLAAREIGTQLSLPE